MFSERWAKVARLAADVVGLVKRGAAAPARRPRGPDLQVRELRVRLSVRLRPSLKRGRGAFSALSPIEP
eukprot:8672750-Pyramimonas_sp.AAC.2